MTEPGIVVNILRNMCKVIADMNYETGIMKGDGCY